MTTIEKIALLIRESGLTQKAFAEKAGVKPTTLNTILKSGTKNINIDTIRNVSSIYGVTMDYLLDDTTVDREAGKYWDIRLSGSEGRMVAKYRMLDLHGQELVDVVLDKETSRMEQEAR